MLPGTTMPRPKNSQYSKFHRAEELSFHIVVLNMATFMGVAAENNQSLLFWRR